MNKVKSLSQQNLSLLLAIYIGIFLNLSVFYRRFDSLAHGLQGIKLISAVTEVIAIVLFTFFIMRLVSLGGRLFYRIVASLLVLISVAASYYMTFFNVVIGYGIVVSVMTTDTDLSKEVVGLHFVLWMVALSALPLLLIWKNSLRYTLIEQLKTPVIASNRCWSCWRWWRWSGCRCVCWTTSKACKRSSPTSICRATAAWWRTRTCRLTGCRRWGCSPIPAMTKVRIRARCSIRANTSPMCRRRTSTIPTWCSSSARPRAGITWACWATSAILRRACRKRRIWWRSAASLATPPLLSLRCMFVREDGTEDNPQRTLKEQNVFAVMKELGFSSELFAMQSEVWFYNNTEVDNYAFREMIASEKRNDGKAVDDMLLVDEMKESLARYPKGKHLVILHTKGSHYLYSQRYPRSYARYQPECMGWMTPAPRRS